MNTNGTTHGLVTTKPQQHEKPDSSWHDESSSGEHGHEKLTFKQGMKRNCVKWWWLYALIVVVVAIVVAIPIVFVGVRNIAQQSLNEATVEVNSQRVSNPGPNSFDLQINTTVRSPSSRRATVEAFNASFFLLNTEPDIKPFIYANFPQVEAAEVSLVNISSPDTSIANMDQLIAYNTLVQNSETFQIGVRGNTQIVLNGLPKYNVDYNKVVTLKGYNRFAGMRIFAVQFHNPPLFDGATLTGKVSIPNPSVISSQFGNVTFQVSTNGTALGSTLLQYVDFRPGNNTYDMRGYLNLATALANTQNYVLNLELLGNSSVNFYGQHLTYYEAALKTNTIRYRLNITEASSTT